eukprot:SM000256S08667  [mRNA]  locus=s256:147180:149514:+ [translate_table: standard]
MAWAAPSAVALGSLAFAVFWLLALFPSLPLLPVGRAAGALLAACLMVVFQVLSPAAAFAAVDLPILALLFGTMLVSTYLERAHLFRHLARALTWRSRGAPCPPALRPAPPAPAPAPHTLARHALPRAGARDLLCRVCLLAGLCSALLTNDTTCVILTPFLLLLCKERSYPPQPFLMALASSANIGSAATPIGNPQNLLVALMGHISFGKFLAGLAPAMLVGLFVNTLGLLALYWRKLSPPAPTAIANGEVAAGSALELVDVPSGEVASPVLSEEVPAVHAQPEQQPASVAPPQEAGWHWRPGLHRLWTAAVYLVTLGMLACLLAGLDLPWTALTTAVVLMCLDFADAAPALAKVSYPLLVFFCGMFISVEGFNSTGAPGAFWKVMEPYARIDNPGGTAVLAVVVIILSNVASNVPTVLLLGPRLAASAAATPGVSVTRAWLLLAWISTVAGNLCMIGSAANLIVSEQASRAKDNRYNLSFWNHLRFGVPSTVIVTALGIPLITS